jgi:hypothetical protein
VLKEKWLWTKAYFMTRLYVLAFVFAFILFTASIILYMITDRARGVHSLRGSGSRLIELAASGRPLPLGRVR